MARYIKTVACEFILVLLASIAMSYLILNGFYVDDALQHGPVPAIASAVCALALFAVARNGKTARIGGITYAACLLLVWIVAGVMTPDGQIFVDNESNYFIFAMSVTLVPTICFLLTRGRAGAAILFIAGVFILAVIQLLYARFELLWTFVFVAACLALIIFKNYQLSLRTATTVRSASMLPGLCVAVAAVAFAVGLGSGIWFGVIAPLNPDAVQIKLVTEYRSLETKQVIGTSNIFQEPNTDLTSKETNDGSRTTDDIKEGSNGVRWAATGKEDDPDDQEDQNTFLGIDIDSLQQDFNFQTNPAYRTIALAFLLVIVLLILAYFLGRRWWRKHRLEKLRALGPEEQFQKLFLFLLVRFKRLGIPVPAGQTMIEFGASADTAVEAFNTAAGVKLSELAGSYSALVYGKGTLSEDAIDHIEAYYNAFYKAAREYLGNVKYFFKSFRL